ncbi:hypothetical protein [Deinococcus aerius]|uniref:hypothetical protein n=1 Tax=Deinococcus aerius TaxID=200253 RepID=UPI0013FD5631|nr:hypothetical protein [Deinococcus aerius]
MFAVAGVVFAVVVALLLFAVLRRGRRGALHQPLPERQERRRFNFVLLAGGVVPATADPRAFPPGVRGMWRRPGTPRLIRWPPCPSGPKPRTCTASAWSCCGTSTA